MFIISSLSLLVVQSFTGMDSQGFSWRGVLLVSCGFIGFSIFMTTLPPLVFGYTLQASE